MPKRGATTSRQLIRLLKKNGFIEDHRTGSHSILYHPQSKRRVVVPFHARDLPKGTVHGILKSAGID